MADYGTRRCEHRFASDFAARLARHLADRGSNRKCNRGHNPGLETLVALLATGQSGDFRGVPPGGIAWLELDGPAEPGSGVLKAFWSP